MSICYLNGQFLPLAEAKISPLDRGFLFGDGIYEFIPWYGGQPVAFGLHIRRLQAGLEAIEISLPMGAAAWRQTCEQLLEANGVDTSGVYLQVSRGADSRRYHGFPEGVSPTVFALLVDIPGGEELVQLRTAGMSVLSGQDFRWRRCNLKSTSLLGNILHLQAALGRGLDETLLYNERGELTEGAASNVFVVTGGEVITPPLDEQILPGVNRHIVLDLLRRRGEWPVREAVVTLEQARAASEIWFTNSSLGVVAVVELDGEPVANGRPGEICQQVVQWFDECRVEC